MKARRVGARLALAALALTLHVPDPLWGQTQNGNIVGSVTDATAAAVAGASLVLESDAIGQRRVATSGADGAYRFSIVPPGVYTLRVEAPGFKQFTNEGFELATNQTLRVDVALSLGEVTERVTVHANAAVLATETADVSHSRDQTMIDRSPNGMNIPTVISGSANISSTTGFLSFYGSGIGHARVTKDGADYGHYNHYIYSYAVSEVQTEALLAPAKYQTPVTVNLVTKRGGNDLHGKFDFSLQNGIFDAKQNPRTHPEKCSPGRPCTGDWWGGLALSGPIHIPRVYDGRNKTFWTFAATRKKNFKSERAITNTVPNAALRSGNISSLPGAADAINPLTGAPFPGGIVPESMISPVSRKLLNLYRQPDVPGGTTASVLARTPASQIITYAARVDQNLTPGSQLSFSWSSYEQQVDTDFADRAVEGYLGIVRGRWSTDVYTFGHTQVISPTIVNEARFGINHEGPTGWLPTTSAAARIQELGLTGVPKPRSGADVAGPDITVPGFTSFIGWGANDNSDRIYHFSDNLSIQRSRHTIQAGFDYRFSDINHDSAGSSVYPSYQFDGRFSGVGFADFLLGLPSRVSRTNNRPVVQARRRSVGLFLQDDWRVTPNLTLNLGVRYDYLAPQWESAGLHYNFDPATGSIVVPNNASLQNVDPDWPIATHPIVTAATAGFPERLVKADSNNLYPRIGFAWRPLGAGVTVIRGGYGIYVVNDLMSGANGNFLLNTGGPFQLSTTFINEIKNGTPLLQWPNGWPAAGGTYNGVPSASGVNPGFVYPYNQQWNLTVEREVLGQRWRVSYVGTKDTHLGWNRDLNIPMPSTTPFDPTRRAYPKYVSVSYTDNGANSSYHSLETAFTFRRVFGLTGDVGYAWAKQISDAGDTYDILSGGAVQNPYCRACDRARTNQVPDHRMFVNLLWQIPYGAGRQFGGSGAGFLGKILGNWDVSTQLRANTGEYFTPTFVGSDPSNTNTFGGRPDVVGDWRLPSGQRNPDHWYNEKAFAVPANNAGRFGNAGRNIVQGPGLLMMDLGVFKSIPVSEKARVLINMTSQNVLNHANWNGIGGAINSANPGFIGGVRGSTSTYGIVGYMRAFKFNVGLEF